MSKAGSESSKRTHTVGGGGASGSSFSAISHLTISVPPQAEELLTSYGRGGISEAKKLLKRGPKLFVNQALGDGERIMSFAIRKKYYDLCEILLVAGEDPNGIVQAGPDRDFPFLHTVAMAGDAKTVKLLLAFGADINRVSGIDLTVWNVAVGAAHDFLTLPDYMREEKCKEARAEAEKRFAEPGRRWK